MNWGIIIIIIDVVKEYVFFCKVGPKEYIEGEVMKMCIRLIFFFFGSKTIFFFFYSKLKSHYHYLINRNVFVVHCVHSWYI